MSICVFVCPSQKLSLLIMAKWSEFLSFSFKIQWVCMVLKILNLYEHQNCMISLKVTMILTMFSSITNQGVANPKVNIFSVLLPQKFFHKQFSFCFQSSNAAKFFSDKLLELVSGGSVINRAYSVQSGSQTSLLWIMGESAGEGMWLLVLTLETGEHDMCHVTCHT